MDFLKEVGKLIEEETKKAQASHESQQEILKQFSTPAPATQRMPSQQAGVQRTPAPQQAAAQRTPSQQSRHQAPRASAQPKQKGPAPQKERIHAATATRRAATEAVLHSLQQEKMQDSMLKFTKKDIIKGIIVSELLGPPPCKRKRE